MELGDKIKKLRKEQNRSLLDISNMCGYSKSLLSKIENGKTVPPISTLMKIAEALGTKVSILLNDEQQSGTVFTPKESSHHKLVKTEKGYSFFAFAVERSEKMMQPYLFVSRKKDHDSEIVHSHVGEEFIFVLEGEMQYKVGNVEYTLKSGDSLYFDSIEKHTLVPITDEIKYIAVFYQPQTSPESKGTTDI